MRAAALQMGSSLALILLSIFVVATIVAALVLRLLYVLLIPAAILAVMTILITPLLLLKLKHNSQPLTWQTAAPRESRVLTPSPAMRRSPETPLPTTPRVRVLETYDLSQTNVEHFLDCNAEQVEAQ